MVAMVKEIRSQAPGLGAYKLFVMLKDVFGVSMPGRDRFYALMHDNGLMLKPERRRHTTNSNHSYRKYTNLVKGFRPERINSLWVADITYIDTDDGVVYLHLLTDAFTHEIIGWILSDTLTAVNTLNALEDGIRLAGNWGTSGLIHHSDRGVQYCSRAYVDRLASINASISMTEDYNPTDNAVAERINGILKQEWLYRMKRPCNMEDAENILRRIILFYNGRRPHRNNPDMMPPSIFRKVLTS